uniref:Uncharacterized protein n=1 Tax=Manihot esculenta TaxID=3983 RepID=A0A2C9VWZ8_MANES
MHKGINPKNAPQSWKSHHKPQNNNPQNLFLRRKYLIF